MRLAHKNPARGRPSFFSRMDDPLAVDVLGNLREYGALGQRHEDAIISGITDASWIDDATAALVDLLAARGGGLRHLALRRLHGGRHT